MCPATRPDSPRQVAEPAPALRTPVAAVGILNPDRDRLTLLTDQPRKLGL